MNLDIINFLIKIACIFLLGVTTELSFRRHFFAMTIFLTGVWATFFRLTILRSVSLYVGAFGHEPQKIVDGVRNAFQSSVVANFTDAIVLVGLILLFSFLKREMRPRW